MYIHFNLTLIIRSDAKPLKLLMRFIAQCRLALLQMLNRVLSSVLYMFETVTHKLNLLTGAVHLF
jgi:hypothetical protein